MLNGSCLVYSFNPPPALRPGGTPVIDPAVIADVVFQSAPGAEAGRNIRLSFVRLSSSMFQSAPGAEAGRNQVAGRGRVIGRFVSIRPRRRGREEPRTCSTRARRLTGFNPPPALRPGGTDHSSGSWAAALSCFNPPPALRPGGTSGYSRLCRTRLRFQSAPGAEAGRNKTTPGCP